MNFEEQKIGGDIGRGYVKGYTEVDGVAKECIFKSVVGIGREMDFSNYKDPIFISANMDKENFNNVFCGILAEVEGFSPIRNSKDSKTTDTVKKLLIALLSKLAEKPIVSIMLGVPNREFTRTNLNEIIECYKGKTIEVTDHITKKSKKIFIKDILIFRESDAALLYQVTYNKPNNSNDNVMVNVGFRTMEISFYDNNLKYNDKKSKSEELGNKTVLEFVKSQHPKRSLEEIDSSNRYDELKSQGYNMLSESIEQNVESFLVNMDEINLYACGGVIKHLNLSNNFIKVDDPQMITAKGLYLVATQKF